jgi:[protein-PII] uridylyltransferase
MRPDWPAKARAAYPTRHDPAYWPRDELPPHIAHAELIREADKTDETFTTNLEIHDFEGYTEITVFAPDHPRLLSVIAGACTIAGANIIDAQIFTTVDGRALDSILIRREFDQEDDERRRARRVVELIEQALAGAMRLPETVAGKAGKKSRFKAFSLESSILVDNTLSNRFTVIEASGLDRSGLLYDLTRAISDLNLNIASAHIVTFGERAVDVFYVTDLTGHKIENASRESAIRKRLRAAFDGVSAASEPARTPSRKRETA